MRSESTRAFGQPKLTKPTLGLFLLTVFKEMVDLKRGWSILPYPACDYANRRIGTAAGVFPCVRRDSGLGLVRRQGKCWRRAPDIAGPVDSSRQGTPSR